MSFENRVIKIQCAFIRNGTLKSIKEYLDCQKGFFPEHDYFGRYKHFHSWIQADIDHVCTLYALSEIEFRKGER